MVAVAPYRTMSGVMTCSAMLMLVRRDARLSAGSFVLRPFVAIGRIVKLSRQNVMRLK
jgi:hypothetical protein